ncbi:hypothetical protein PI125_g8500 [Phytophthora idaei]|nr:hypothetical protein PI125_g8500 [Phytophthora idaei]
MPKTPGPRTYSSGEQLRLVVVVGRVLPIDPEEWKEVERTF